MPVDSLTLTNIGPFEYIDLAFDAQINVLTGPNNSGKSTILWALGELLVFPFTMPDRLLRVEPPKWSMTVSTPAKQSSLRGTFPAAVNDFIDLYTSIGHTSFIPAQRTVSSFRSSGPHLHRDSDARLEHQVDSILQSRPQLERQDLIDTLRKLRKRELHPELDKRSKLIVNSPSIASDEHLIQKMIDLDYRSYRSGNSSIRELLNQIASITTEITEGFPITSFDISEDAYGLYPRVTTPDGSLPLNSLSQGTMSVIHCLAHVLLGYAEYYEFPTDLQSQPGILFIDEIDAHLHPSWQRRILPAITRHFPKLQIFCSTHSPLMLAGLQAGQVQLLKRSENGSINATTNEKDIVGWTADEILRNVLELPYPTDLQTYNNLKRLEELQKSESLSATELEELERLRTTVSESLISAPMTDAIEKFAADILRHIDESKSARLKLSELPKDSNTNISH